MGFLMGQHARVADKARLNIPESSAEPVRKLAGLARRPSRTTDTKDLSASLRSNGRLMGVSRVLNLCEGGMLVESPSDLEVGGLELPVGTQISFAGSGRVAYRTDTTAGVTVDPWHEAPEAIRALVSGETKLGPRREDAYVTEWS